MSNRTVNIVTVDNGDTEPELWAFEQWEDAEAFAEVRSANASVTSVVVLSGAQARALISDEQEGV